MFRVGETSKLLRVANASRARGISSGRKWLVEQASGGRAGHSYGYFASPSYPGDEKDGGTFFRGTSQERCRAWHIGGRFKKHFGGVAFPWNVLYRGRRSWVTVRFAMVPAMPQPTHASRRWWAMAKSIRRRCPMDRIKAPSSGFCNSRFAFLRNAETFGSKL